VRPTPDQLLSLAPDLDPRLTTEHLRRLDEDYFRIFSVEEICEHIRELSRLDPQNPAGARARRKEDLVQVTVFAFDHPGAFALITGILSSAGFGIQSGQIFTYREMPDAPDVQARRIVDIFVGQVDSDLALREWEELVRSRLREIFGLLQEGTEAARRGARRRVHEWVADRLAVLSAAEKEPVLYPVELSVSTDAGDATILRVRSQDTPFFLYTLGNALALHGIYIERVKIRTVAGKVDDEIRVRDSRGKPITDPEDIRRLKLSVLLTKQFSYFLDRSPDPSTALERFEQVLGQVIESPESGKFIAMISDPQAMQDLAQLLGTSDFLWEDFIRLQYESLLPILRSRGPGAPLAVPPDRLEEALARELTDCHSYEEARERLNRFKDRQIFLIDLENILYHQGEFDLLAGHLTALAEAVVRTAVRVVYDDLRKRYGEPRSVAGLPSTFAVFGLGKFGGAALGYASDIELLTVYSDAGTTAGPEKITNAEFYSLMVQRLSRFITAKRTGIFRVDLRLRPYGESGPLACSLDSFCRYYGPGGAAHSYEKLALVRLRAVAGDPELGKRVERLRDEFVYLRPDINLEELRNLRALQADEKNRPGRLNAKFSPGALVDLEYTVQILQVTHGGRHPELRTPRLREALDALSRTGVIPEAEAVMLVDAYRFLRRLINALRMLRGSALDLFLPPLDSDEYRHLARRMGYQPRKGLSPPQQLHLDFETHTAAVRAFARRVMGRDALLPGAPLSVADIVLSPSLPPPSEENILKAAGCRDVRRGVYNLRQLAGRAASPAEFAPLAVLAFDILRREADPDLALNNWERFVSGIPYAREHYEVLMAQPRRLEILLGIFSRSQFFSDTLCTHPEFFDWVTDPRVLHHPRRQDERLSELRGLCLGHPSDEEWRKALCLFRRRELLRIGARDIFLHISIEDITRDLSQLADSIILAEIERLSRNRDHSLPIAVIAMGKLGGNELNYSSDIDLVILHENLDSPAAAELQDRIRLLLADLGAVTEHGRIYRVDLRLRPYGRSGELTLTLSSFRDYFRSTGRPEEIQALLKSRVLYAEPVKADEIATLIGDLLQELAPPPDEVAENVRRLRARSSQEARDGSGIDLKLAPGGIRDVEFLVQAYQLSALRRYPELRVPGTLEALDRLARLGLLPQDVTRRLADNYRFLRRLEHFLQIMDDRQVHVLPLQIEYLHRLARRLHGPEGDGVRLSDELRTRMEEVRETFDRYIDRLRG